MIWHQAISPKPSLGIPANSPGLLVMVHTCLHASLPCPCCSSAWNAVLSLLNIVNLLHPLKQSSSLPHLCSHSPPTGSQGATIVCYKCSHPLTSLSLTRLIAPSEKSLWLIYFWSELSIVQALLCFNKQLTNE